jgi:hypothetical protein
VGRGATGEPNADGALVEELEAFAERLEFPLKLHAEMTAYASGTVYDAAEEFRVAMIFDARITAQVMRQASTGHTVFVPLQNSARCLDAANRMARLVSDDLHGLLVDDHGRPPTATVDGSRHAQPVERPRPREAPRYRLYW